MWWAGWSGGGSWGGQLLVTHHRADGVLRRYVRAIPREEVQLDTASADLILGSSGVRQHGGVYRVSGSWQRRTLRGISVCPD